MNVHLLKDLIACNCWNDDIKNRLIADNGSVQNISAIPQHLKELYKTGWELSQKDIIIVCSGKMCDFDLLY